MKPSSFTGRARARILRMGPSAGEYVYVIRDGRDPSDLAGIVQDGACVAMRRDGVWHDYRRHTSRFVPSSARGAKRYEALPLQEVPKPYVDLSEPLPTTPPALDPTRRAFVVDSSGEIKGSYPSVAAVYAALADESQVAFNARAIAHTSAGLRFTATRADLADGVVIEVDDSLSSAQLAQAVSGFIGWHALTIHPLLNGFSGYDAVAFRPAASQDPEPHEAEVFLLRSVLSHPAGFTVDLFAGLTVRRLEDGRFAVDEEAFDRPVPIDHVEETLFDTAEAACRHFVLRRHALKLGDDWEIRLAAETKETPCP